MKKFFVALTVFLFAFVLTSICYAADDVSVCLNGKRLNFDVEPTIIKDRTMVPMRIIFEELGADIEWNDKTKTVSAAKDNTNIVINMGSSHMYKNQNIIKLDSPAIILESRMFVPVRAVAEALDCIVVWESETRTVYITTWEKTTQKTVKVSTATKLLNAIGSNKKIILTSSAYNLSSIDFDDIHNEHIVKDEDTDRFTIKNVYNLTIEGIAEIQTENLSADVLSFENCGSITLKGLTLGHKKPNDFYQCEGAVIRFTNCNDVTIEKSNLFGCGSTGIYTNNMIGLKCDDVKIYECTYAGICNGWGSSLEATINNTEIYDSNFFGGAIYINGKFALVELNNCKIYDTVSENLITLDLYDNLYATAKVILNNCEVYNNSCMELAGGNRKNGIIFNDCIFEKDSDISSEEEDVIEKPIISITSEKEKIDTLDDIRLNVEKIDNLPQNAELRITIKGTGAFAEVRTVSFDNINLIRLSQIFNEDYLAGEKFEVEVKIYLPKKEGNYIRLDTIVESKKEFYWKTTRKLSEPIPWGTEVEINVPSTVKATDIIEIYLEPESKIRKNIYNYVLESSIYYDGVKIYSSSSSGIITTKKIEVNNWCNHHKIQEALKNKNKVEVTVEAVYKVFLEDGNEKIIDTATQKVFFKK